MHRQQQSDFPHDRILLNTNGSEILTKAMINPIDISIHLRSTMGFIGISMLVELYLPIVVTMYKIFQMMYPPSKSTTFITNL